MAMSSDVINPISSVLSQHYRSNVCIIGFFFSAGHKEGVTGQNWNSCQLIHAGFLGSTDIHLYETGENKAVRILAAGDSAGDLNMSTVASVTCFGVTSKASLCNI